MGKFDSLIKYLGKEDSYSPEQVIKSLDNQEKMDQLNDLTNVSAESMDNIEKLISGSGIGPSSGEPASAASPAPQDTPPAVINVDVDPDVLKELENMDSPPPNIEELQNRLKVTSYDQVPDGIAGEEPLPALDEDVSPVSDEAMPADEDFLTPKFREQTPVEEEPLTFDEGIPQESAAASGDDFGLTSPESEISDLFKEGGDTELSALEEPSFMPDIPETLDTGGGETFPAISPEVSPEVLPEVSPEGEISGLDMLETPDMPEMPEMGEETAPQAGMADFPSFDEMVQTPAPEMEMPAEPESGAEMPSFAEFSDISDHIDEYRSSRPVEAERPESILDSRSGFDGKQSEIQIDSDKMIRIRNRINKLSDPILRKKVRQVFIENKLPPDVTNRLVAALVLNEDESKIQAIVAPYMPDAVIEDREKKLKQQAQQEAVRAEQEKPKRRVIYTEETKRTQEFQHEFQNVSKYAFLIFFVVVLLGFVFWRMIWVPGTANRYYSQGLSALKREEYQIAEAKFESGKKVSGPSLKWYNIYGVQYMTNKQYDGAKRKFQDALEFDPIDKTTIYNFADYYKMIYPPKFDEAVKLYVRLLKKDPKSFEYLDKVGQTYIQWGDRTVKSEEQNPLYLTANQLYESYLDKNPKDTASFYRLLDIALRLKNEDRVDSLYDSLDHVNNKAVNVRTLTDLARHYTDKRNLRRAKQVLDKLMPSNPQYDESYFEYARFLTINRDFFRAIKAVSNAIVLNDKNAKAYNLLGEIYFINDEIPNNKLLAKQQFENAVKNNQNFFKPYVNLGHIYYYNSLNFSDSDQALSKAFESYKLAETVLIQYGPPVSDEDIDPLLSYNLGWLYYRNQDYASAFEEFNQLYIKQPNDPVLTYNLGNSYYHLDKLELARVEYDKSVEYYQAMATRVAYINPDSERHKEIFMQLARSYNNRGVVYALMAKQAKKGAEMEQHALLDFYRAKDNANKINTLYSFAEANIKYILNKAIKNRNPVLDDELMKKTSLKKLADEFREKMIETL